MSYNQELFPVDLSSNSRAAIWDHHPLQKQLTMFLWVSLSFRRAEIKKKKKRPEMLCLRIQGMIQKRVFLPVSELCGETLCSFQRCGCCWQNCLVISFTDQDRETGSWGISAVNLALKILYWVFFCFNLSYLSSVRHLIDLTTGFSSSRPILN